MYDFVLGNNYTFTYSTFCEQWSEDFRMCVNGGTVGSWSPAVLFSILSFLNDMNSPYVYRHCLFIGPMNENITHMENHISCEYPVMCCINIASIPLFRKG